MNKQSSVNINLYIGYAVFAGLAGFFSGKDVFFFALKAIGYAQTSENMAMKEYFANGFVGLLLFLGGAALFVSIYGLLQEEEWGNKTGFYASLASAIGWLGILGKIPAITQFGLYGFKINRSGMFSHPSNQMVGIITSVPVLIVLVAVTTFFTYYMSTMKKE